MRALRGVRGRLGNDASGEGDISRVDGGEAVIVDLAELRKLSGLTRPADVRRWLTRNGVRFLLQPSGDPVTTLDAINRALYGAGYNKPDLTPPHAATKGSRSPRQVLLRPRKQVDSVPGSHFRASVSKRLRGYLDAPRSPHPARPATPGR